MNVANTPHFIQALANIQFIFIYFFNINTICRNVSGVYQEALSLQNSLLHSFYPFLPWLMNGMLGLFPTTIFGITLYNSFHLHLREGIIHFS